MRSRRRWRLFSRVVYVDNDPLVLAHARALLTSSSQGRTAYIHADARDPSSILSSAVVGETLDFSQPVGLILVGILHLLPDEDKPGEIVATLLNALPPGSYLVSSHLTLEHDTTRLDSGIQTFKRAGMPRAAARLRRVRFARLLRPGAGAAGRRARVGVAAVRDGTPADAGRGELLRRRRSQAVRSLACRGAEPRAAADGVLCYGGGARKA